MKINNLLVLNKKLNNLTVNELKSIIKKSGYKGYSNLIKKDLIKHIIKYKLYKNIKGNENSPTRDGSESKGEYKEDNIEESRLINPYYLTKYENIHKFLKTYNTDYLRILNGDELNTLKNSHFINPVRKKLIENMNGRKDYIVENIEGAISFSYHKIKHNDIIKTFYIYGERHKDTTGHCRNKNNIDFAEYMKLVSQQTDKFIDFYYEDLKPNFDFYYNIYKTYITFFLWSLDKNLTSDPFALEKNTRRLESTHNIFYSSVAEERKLIESCDETNSKIINKLHSEFTECTKPETRNNPKCGLMRSHYIDIRFSMKSHYNDPMIKYLSIYNYITADNLRNKLKLLNYFGADTLIETIFQLNLEIDQNTYPQLILDFYLEKIPELNKINRSYYKQEIYEFSKLHISNRIFRLILMRGKYNSLKDFLQESYEMIKYNFHLRKQTEIINNLNYLFFNIGLLLVDIYCLSRIFKNFKSNGKSPSEPNTIIIYTGNSHSETYRNFLNFICTNSTNINLLSTFIIPSQPTSCVNMPYKYHI